jgi:hypothetical protein
MIQSWLKDEPFKMVFNVLASLPSHFLEAKLSEITTIAPNLFGFSSL